MKTLLLSIATLAAAITAPGLAAAHPADYHPPARAYGYDGPDRNLRPDFVVVRRGDFLHQYVPHGAHLVVLHDWRRQRLYAPRRNQEWVRFRGEALLIHAHSGRILDIVPLAQVRRW